MIRFFATHKYQVTGGTCPADQWERMVQCYESRGFTVTKLGEV